MFIVLDALFLYTLELLLIVHTCGTGASFIVTNFFLRHCKFFVIWQQKCLMSTKNLQTVLFLCELCIEVINID